MDAFKLIRLASVADLEHVLDLICKTWINDPIFNCVVPGLREFPDQYKKVWRRILEGDYFERGTVFIAICKDGSTDIRDAVAFGMWQRSGSSDIAKAWQTDSLEQKFNRAIQKVKMIHSFTLGNKEGISIVKAKEMGKQDHDAIALFPDERWRAKYLTVSPDFQGKGLGKRLVQWGIDRSEEEGCTATLEASKVGKPLYEKMGFVEVGMTYFDGGTQELPAMVRQTRGPKRAM